MVVLYSTTAVWLAQNIILATIEKGIRRQTRERIVSRGFSPLTLGAGGHFLPGRDHRQEDADNHDDADEDNHDDADEDNHDDADEDNHEDAYADNHEDADEDNHEDADAEKYRGSLPSTLPRPYSGITFSLLIPA